MGIYRMIRFLFPRLISGLLSVILILVVTFFLMRLIPGDPFQQEVALSDEVLSSLKQHYGLNLSTTDYIHYLVYEGLGHSIHYPDLTVWDVIQERFPISLQIGIQALFIAICAGITLGIFLVYRPSFFLNSLLLIAVSVPSFLQAALIQYGFSVHLGWFPIGLWGNFNHTILPSFCLAIVPTAFIARLLKGNLKIVLQQDYMQFAKAKGLPKRILLFRHALPNALYPTLAYISPIIPALFTGSFIIEKLFAIPGLGRNFLNAILQKDYPLIIGETLFYSLFFLASTLLMDCICYLLNPQMRKE